MYAARFLLPLSAACRLGFDVRADASSDGAISDVVEEPYRMQVLGDGPVGYWRLDELSGTVATDSSSSAFHGQYVGTVTYGVGGALAEPSTAIELAGTGAQYLDFGGRADFDPGTESFTVEVWLKMPTTDWIDYVDLVAKRPPASTANYWTLHAFPSNVIRFELRDAGGANVYDTIVGAISDSQWHHYVAVVDREAGTHMAYLDAVMVASKDIATLGPVVPPASMRAGADALGAPFQIDELAIYRHSLSSARIAAHFAAAGR